MKQLRQTLYIMTPERYLSLDGENVVVQEKKTVLARLPLHNLDESFVLVQQELVRR